MSDIISTELVAKMMVKCARRCCICRRFRPTKLQVHHILERSNGGNNEEDNLIVACFSCHTDVHSQIPFARRFSIEELRGHRDALVKMVEEGRLPVQDNDDADNVIAATLKGLSEVAKSHTGLSPEAVEMLLYAVNDSSKNQGIVMISLHSEGLTVQAGQAFQNIGHDDHRTQAKYKSSIKQLVNCGLLEYLSEDVLEVTDLGYLAAEEAIVNQGRPPTET